MIFLLIWIFYEEQKNKLDDLWKFGEFIEFVHLEKEIFYNQISLLFVINIKDCRYLFIITVFMFYISCSYI